MPVHNYQYRYELKPGRYVYVQEKASRISGLAIIRQVLKKYEPHRIFYHLERRGGHVAALRLHQNSAYLSRFDITNFFGQITRTRISRAMKSIGFSQFRAFHIAMDSVVVEGGRKVLPFGFCQSPVLATVCLEQSHLGGTLRELNVGGLLVSVYMDDILLSHDDQHLLRDVSERVAASAQAAGFPLGAGKRTVALPAAEVFNCRIADGNLTILDPRMQKFVQDHRDASDDGQAAIEGYIAAISHDELLRFRATL